MGALGRSLVALTLTLGAAVAVAQAGADAERRASRHFESIRNQHPLLVAFLQEMPKGGDLHNHLWGAIYAEEWIDFAAQDGLCVDRTTSLLLAPPCDVSCDKYTSKPAVSCAYADHVLYNSVVDAWSMRNWTPGDGSGHDHFFATFDKFSLTAQNHAGDEIAEAAARAAADHLQYVEIMHTADGSDSAALGAKAGWDDDLGRLRERLLASGLKEIVTTTRERLNQSEKKMQSELKCGTPDADPGCDVKVRYLYQVLRGLPREQVFAQILLGFELAQADPRFVGLNLVMPTFSFAPCWAAPAIPRCSSFQTSNFGERSGRKWIR